MKKSWSPDELETLHSMLAEKKTPKEIAEVLGCVRARVDHRIRHERMTPDQRLIQKKKRAAWDMRNRTGVRSYREQIISSSRPTSELIEEAQQRALAPRSLTSEFFGDPPKGWSALDRKIMACEVG